VAAAALGTAGVIAGTTSWTEAISIAGTAHSGSGHPAGRAGTSAFDSATRLKSQAAAISAAAQPWLP